ncbi:MAG: sulfatase-like hydrolase/transferase [Isosphaeraceae bacterium]
MQLARIAAVFGLLVIGSPALAADRPNVVLILADDLGGSDLGCYGSKFHKTPNLDKLAEAGCQFTQAYSACPVCSPTRAALMTGKHPARLHLTDWLPGRGDRPDQKLLRPKIPMQLPLEETTLAELFKKAGYTTAIMGKWHLGGAGFEPTKQGFDVNIAGDDRGSPPSYFAPYMGKSNRPLVGLEQAPEGEYLTDRLASEAAKFIEGHKDQPFFLYLPHYAVHTPMQAPADAVTGFPKWDGTPHGRQENPTYAAMLQSLDNAVGKVVESLEKAGLTQKTLILFTSDNGGLATREGPNTPATNNAPHREGKGWLYEGGIRVPLIVAWPGKIEADVAATPVYTADLLPTIADFCGLEVPETLDGISLARFLIEGVEPNSRVLYWHYPHYSNQGGRPGGAVRDGDLKLVVDYETNRRELFDLAADPSESRNIAAQESSRVASLAARLAAWRKHIGAEMPTPNPGYVPNPQAADGVVTLPARTAEVHGSMLRYEPLPHKNTLGFWVNMLDWASWEFEVTKPGAFEVVALVGCGAGSGGSTVQFQVDDQVLSLTVPVTGGFQKFQPQTLGKVVIDKPGRHKLNVRPLAKPGLAVMDLREVKLSPTTPPPAPPAGLNPPAR